MARLSIGLLGPFYVLLNGEPITRFESDKVRVLLAYLALESDHPSRRETLASLLWPERPGQDARHDLSQALYSLRHAIGGRDAEPPLLIATHQTVQFAPSSDRWLDAAAFTELCEACQEHAHRRLDLCAPCLDRLHQAVTLYRGSFLEGLSPGESLPFEEWLLLQQERFHRLAVDALRLLSNCYARRGEYGRALEYARRHVELEPWREEAHRQLICTLAIAGHRGAALAQYEACRKVLNAELGIEPEEATTRLYHHIRSGHEWLLFPDLPPHNLPAPLTPLVGQEIALAAVKARLCDPACRLLTLVGPGGIGKTRLALEASRDLLWGEAGFGDQAHPFPQGIYLIPLAHLQSADAILPALAEALGLSFYREGALTVPPPTPKQQLLSYLRHRRLLLILDGFEHLLEGAALVSDVLHAAPGVKVLITSHMRLNVQGEHLYPVPPLEIPKIHPVGALETDRACQCSAVELFSASARRVKPGFEATAGNLEPVVQICRLVQGIPLAILLAAAWMETLPIEQVAAQLLDQSLDFLQADWSDVPERQHSIRAVFDRSWNLLTRRQQEVLAGLSVFCGGFSEEAARQIVGASAQELLNLTRRSLFQRTATQSMPQADQSQPRTDLGIDGCYEMYELLRQYAAEKLEDMPGAGQAVRERHATYFATVPHG
jgi:predicted ATPase/DNA-binding SARP family transcriptional activator